MSVKDLNKKVQNEGATPEGVLTANEYNILLSAVQEHEDKISKNTTELNNKAGKATTLSGYGIEDAYTKDEVYSKDEISAAITREVTYQTRDFYTRSEVKEMYALKEDVTETVDNAVSALETSTTAELKKKQSTITDLATIREGAALGATAVQPEDVPTKLSQLTDDIYCLKGREVTLASNQDADTLVNGVYLNQTANGSGNTNFPDGYSIILAMRAYSTYQAQLSISTSGLKTRWKLGDYWRDWLTYLNTNNYADYVLPKTGGEVTGNTTFIGDTIVKVLDYGAVTISGDSSKEDGMTLRFSRIDGNKSYGQILFQSGNANGVKIASEWAAWANRNNLVIYTSNNTTAPYEAVWEKSFEVTHEGKVKIFKKLITPSITLNNKEITELYSKTEVDAELKKKQESLVDNVNIKTINGQSILGSGDITIRGDGSDMAVVSISLDVSQLTVGSYVTITREQYEKILLSRKGYCVVIADANFTGNYAYDESEWGQVISCYRQYFGSSAFMYRLSVIHHAGDMGSNTPPNTQIYTIEFIDMTTGGMASSTYLHVRAINNLY